MSLLTRVDGSQLGGGFERFGEDAQWFRTKLAAEGVTLQRGSPMDDALNAMTKIADAVNAGIEPELRSGDALLHLLTDGVGGRNLVHFIRKAVHVDPNVFHGKWPLFRGPDAILARYRGPSPTRNLTWELYVAAICLARTANVRIAQGNENPDVRCNVGDNTWGIECKVPDSQDPEQQVRLVKKAARQLQDAGVDRGVIAVNLTSVVDHTRFSDSIRTYGTRTYGPTEVMSELQRQVNALVQPYTMPAFSDWMKKRRTPRAILFHADAIALAAKTVSLTTYQVWLDLHRPDANALVVPFMWPEADDRAMAAVFD